MRPIDVKVEFNFHKRLIKKIQGLYIYRDGQILNKIKNKPLKGTFNKKTGYIFSHVYFEGKRRLIPHHRIIFYIVYGYYPKYIDHKNGDKLDNRIENLRECTYSNNMQNRKRTNKRKNTSKYKGVYKRKDGRKKCWTVKIGTDSKYVGNYYSEDEAALAYNNAVKKIYGPFAYQNEIKNDSKRD